MDEKMREMGIRAKHAAGVLATLTTEEKNAGLLAIADALRARQTEIMAANTLDLEAGLCKQELCAVRSASGNNLIQNQDLCPAFPR